MFSSYRAGLWLPDEKPMYGARLIKDHPLAKGLVGDWIFNEYGGNIAFDGSGFQNHGTMHNCAWSPKGIDFNGASSYIEMGNNPILTNAITIEAQVKVKVGASGWHVIMGRDYTQWELMINTDNRVVFNKKSGGGYEGHIWTQTISEGIWHHIALTFLSSSKTAHLYWDGDGVSSAFTFATDEIGNANTIQIGRRWSGLFDDFDGIMKFARLYEIEKTPKEIWQLSHNPYCMYEYPILKEGMVYSPTIMNQFQRANLGADLMDGVLIT